MNEILKILVEIAQTPLPTILVIGGILFFFLAVAGKIGAKIVVNPQKQTLAAVLGGFLLITGTLLYIARPYELTLEPTSSQVSSSQPSVSLTRDFLTSHTWEFLHGEGDIISPQVRLDPSGMIEGVDHPNETRWGLEEGTLVFYHLDGQPSTRFTEMHREGGKVVLSGRLLLAGDEPVVIHVLKER